MSRYPIPRAPDSSGQISTPKAEPATRVWGQRRKQTLDLRSTALDPKIDSLMDKDKAISSRDVDNFFGANFHAIENVLTINPVDQQPLDEAKNTLINKIEEANDNINTVNNDMETLEKSLKTAHNGLRDAAEAALKPQESIRHLNGEMALIKKDLQEIEKNKEMTIRAMFLNFIMRFVIMIAWIYLLLRNVFISIGSIKKIFQRKKNDRVDPLGDQARTS